MNKIRYLVLFFVLSSCATTGTSSNPVSIIRNVIRAVCGTFNAVDRAVPELPEPNDAGTVTATGSGDF